MRLFCVMLIHVFYHISKHLEFRLNSAARGISIFFSVFGNVMKHCLKCLIYYLKSQCQFLAK